MYHNCVTIVSQVFFKGVIMALAIEEKFQRNFVYEVIADELRAKIVNGELKPGSAIISERRLATLYNVNHSTARKATQKLVNEGVLNKVHGKGVLVAEGLNEKKFKKTKYVGFLLCQRNRNLQFYSKLIIAIEQELVKNGLQMVFGTYSGQEELPSMLADRFIDGIIVTGEISSKLNKKLYSSVEKYVLISPAYMHEGKTTTVSGNFIDMIHQGVDHLIGSGHKKIGLIRGTSPELFNDNVVEKTFLEALENHDLPVAPHNIINCAEFSRECAFNTVKASMNAADFTAILTTTSDFACGALDAFNHKGVSVPDDVSIISLDGTDELEFCRPPITAIDNPAQKIGLLAVKKLLKMINSDFPDPTLDLVKYKLRIRDSVKHL